MKRCFRGWKFQKANERFGKIFDTHTYVWYHVSMLKRQCKKTCEKDRFGNCSILDEDGFPLQCVGSWVQDKYFCLENYLNATCEARRKFADKGNAVFIDLFSGPGKCVTDKGTKIIDGGALRAFKREEAPFNQFYFIDTHKQNIESLEKRISLTSNCNFWLGDSNVLISKLVDELSPTPYRYHFAYIDPFGPDGLKYATLRALAQFERMDMLIHFPIGAIKRNIPKWRRSGGKILDEYLGTSDWRDRLKDQSESEIYKILIDIYTEQLKAIGYPENGLKLASSENLYTGLPVVSVQNKRNVDLYVLILASKHQLAQRIWNSVIKYSRNGQKSFI